LVVDDFPAHCHYFAADAAVAAATSILEQRQKHNTQSVVGPTAQAVSARPPSGQLYCFIIAFIARLLNETKLIVINCRCEIAAPLINAAAKRPLGESNGRAPNCAMILITSAAAAAQNNAPPSRICIDLCDLPPLINFDCSQPHWGRDAIASPRRLELILMRSIESLKFISVRMYICVHGECSLFMSTAKLWA
jgi:hypothetical protein